MKIHQFRHIALTGFVFVLFLGVTSANAAPWAGSGTSADPYQIWNASDLNAIDANLKHKIGDCPLLYCRVNIPRWWSGHA